MSAIENETIEDNDYLIQKRPNVINFARADNTDCYISILLKSDNSISIEWFVCTSESGTGRALMKDSFLYLLNKYPDIFHVNTEVSLIVQSKELPNSNITERSDEKLANYYKSIGFDNERRFIGKIILSGTIGNIIQAIINYRKSGGRKKRKTKRRKTKRRKYTKRRK
jgi:hypothetical protein